ncbi:hypothetical protein L6164_008501 [Bauhinia variegata]|uniref:Uncharacterized protein n=1 Tax=Bauhinia variegata TaxID=167791 RepID=A0ACB9PI29_BAUVA|nr:hypothetical protein L6164_008501 [Bauhinia variegata]
MAYLDWTPRVGIEFENIEEALQLWIIYGRKISFGVRKQYTNTSKKDKIITSFGYVCIKEGHRRVDKRDNESLWKNEFTQEHNHPMQLPETTHMLALHPKISKVQAYEIDLAEDSGLPQASSFKLMNTHVRHRDNIRYTRLDVKNYRKARR